MTTALEGGEWSAARPGLTLPPGKTRYPFYRRLGGFQDRSGHVRKISPPHPGFDPRTVQPAVSRYTDWATGTSFVSYIQVYFISLTSLCVLCCLLWATWTLCCLSWATWTLIRPVKKQKRIWIELYVSCLCHYCHCCWCCKPSCGSSVGISNPDSDKKCFLSQKL
jgi:hypothetical protein